MLPKTLALVEDDVSFANLVAEYLRQCMVAGQVFTDGEELLADRAPFDFGFYIVDLMLPGVDGVELIRILRRRTNAGLLVVTARLQPDVFDSVLTAGADMYLPKPVTLGRLLLAIKTVQRRAKVAHEQKSSWRLNPHSNELIAPDGARVALSETDLTVLECLLRANGNAVTRAALNRCLGRPATADSDGLLNATIYRLRRRISRATNVAIPLQSQSRVGYVFRAHLSLV